MKVANTITASIALLCGLIIGYAARRPHPVFDTIADRNVAIDSVTGEPVLIVKRDLYERGWNYTVASAGLSDGQGPHLGWRWERELVSPPDRSVTREWLRHSDLKDCTLHMSRSSPDLNLTERYEVHVDEKGIWSFPIKDGEVVIPVSPARP